MELQKILNIFEEHGFNENNCSFFKQEDITDIAKDVLKAINFTHCCTELNGKKIIPFDDWIDLKKYTQLTPNIYKKGLTYVNHKSLFRQYKSENNI